MGNHNNTINKIIYPQSAVIPFQIKNDQLKVLLITSIKSGQWIFPKGIIEEHLTSHHSAMQEALEEAGVKGDVIDYVIGEYSYPKWGGICEVVVFPMRVTEVLDEWLEADSRQRKWVTITKALRLISKKELKNMLVNFHQNINSIKSAKIFPHS